MNAVSLAPRPPPIRGAALRRALIAGARRVIARRDRLNRINVFPVPDGDTGSNLAFTLGSVLTGALNRHSRGVGDLLRRVGDQAVDGARGNSGAILASFFSGLAESVGTRVALGPQAFAAAIRTGAASARQALAEPREGTILSVIQAFAEALEERDDVGNLRDWFRRALEQSQRALARTPEQLAVLRSAGVVDAGGQGFVDLLEGVDEFMASGRFDAIEDEARNEVAADLEAAQAHGELGESDPGHRWCTECLLLGEGLDRAGIRAGLSELGASCVVVAGSHSRLRLHAHVADPRALFALAGRFGRVEACKADDMLAQARSAANGTRVAVITDSAADLPDALANALNIHSVPVRVSFGESDYLDRVGISTHEFYRRLREEVVLPKTSQPPAGDFRRQFEFLLSHHPALVYVGLSRAVSGTLQAGEAAAQRGHAERIHVFDSRNAAGGQALLAVRAAELAAEGADPTRILAELERLRPLTFTFAIARNVRHAVRGGRIPAWAGHLIAGLGLTPQAKFLPDGRLRPARAHFGGQGLPARFARSVARQLPRGHRWRVIVGHCDAATDARRLADEVRRRLQPVELHLVETGPALGAHAGPGALVLSAMAAD
jgi:hypothetical protein